MAKQFHLIVTFDVPGAKPGDRRYNAVDALLSSHGNLTKVFKQVRLLTTPTLPSQLTRLITSVIGPVGSVMVVHAARPYRFVLGQQNPNAPHRAKLARWFLNA